MKTIGLLGGMSWQSSVEYYRSLNQAVQQRLGGHNNARTCAAARSVEVAGADCVLPSTNTIHKMAGAIEAAISIPLPVFDTTRIHAVAFCLS